MIHCQTFADLIPVTFVLGFYVSIILARSEYIILIFRILCRYVFVYVCIHHIALMSKLKIPNKS